MTTSARTLRILLLLWKALARRLGRINTLLLLVISYYAVLLPLSLFLRRRHTRQPGWRSREPLPPEHFRKQY
ncbi:MAG: hypothetical protein HY645_15160 [Acidobacteria bacterium]|nr:hypothetical protein [Acidobacteriota bacterium]